MNGGDYLYPRVETNAPHILGVSTLFYSLPYFFIRFQKVSHISRIFQRFPHSSTSF